VLIQGILWAGVRVDEPESAIRFFRDLLGLEIAEQDAGGGFTLFRLPSGQEFELLGPNSRWYRVHEDRVVVGFQVADVPEARRELQAEGIEFVTETAGDAASGQWCYFRGPGGVLFEICSTPTLPA
jgi:catechol 2,3-dioxygenase-like lactoylglutathione lyase family enzyme